MSIILSDPRVTYEGRELEVVSAELRIAPRVDFDQDVDESVREDGGATVGDGWYCVRTNPFPCPAAGCDFVALFMTAAHRIVVWPSSDDPKILREAHRAQTVGRNPRIVEYSREFGPCIPWDLWIRIGKPVHGLLAEPSGWPPRFTPA
jgi:hypothetical protein